MAALSPTASSLSNRYEPEESTQALLTIRGSEFGSRYINVDDSGVYMSSLVVTILLSFFGTIGTILFAVVITQAVQLTSCDSDFELVMENTIQSPSEICYGFRMNAELNNIQNWVLPPECETFVSGYMKSRYYQLELQGAVDAVKMHLETLVVKLDGLDVVVMDVDETAISNLPYYKANGYGITNSNKNTWNKWVQEFRAPALTPILNLYRELQAANWGIVFVSERPESQRNHTVKNLYAAGYNGWTSLIMRSKSEENLSSATYKSRQRSEVQRQGYRIHTTIGDQWSDFKGPATGTRVFKIPNPMYFVS